jgi:hypothetical protein
VVIQRCPSESASEYLRYLNRLRHFKNKSILKKSLVELIQNFRKTKLVMIEEEVPSYDAYDNNNPNASKKSNISIKLEFPENKQIPLILSW